MNVHDVQRKSPQVAIHFFSDAFLADQSHPGLNSVKMRSALPLDPGSAFPPNPSRASKINVTPDLSRVPPLHLQPPFTPLHPFPSISTLFPSWTYFSPLITAAAGTGKEGRRGKGRALQRGGGGVLLTRIKSTTSNPSARCCARPRPSLLSPSLSLRKAMARATNSRCCSGSLPPPSPVVP